MIEWFTWIQVGIAALAGAFCVVWGLIGRPPNDATLGAAAIVEVLLIIQLVIALVAPAVGNPASGSALEYFLYLISAIILVPLAVFWALIERNRWSTVIVGVACLAVAVMVYRMNEIWLVQVA